MDFSFNDNEWIVDVNTDRLNRELFEVNTHLSCKRSRRRKRRKIETASVENVHHEASATQTRKTPMKFQNIKKDHLPNLMKGKTDSLTSEKTCKDSNDSNHHKGQKIGNSTVVSSEFLTGNSSKLNFGNKMKKQKTNRKKNLEIGKMNLSSKQNCDIAKETLLTIGKLHKNRLDEISINKNVNSSVVKKKRKRRRNKSLKMTEPALQCNILPDEQSSLPSAVNSTTLQINKLKDIFQNAQSSHTTKLKSEAIQERKKGTLILERGKRQEYSDIVRKQAADRLKSAQFRFINEKMYTTTGKESMQLFKSDPNAFEIYHDGFQAQVNKWPVNPVDVLISEISNKPKTLKIADFGCGNAKIAQAFLDRQIYSFDLMSLNSYVTACDMANVPLATESVDIAIFCLALMGKNLNDYLCEAHRILKMRGQLKIAEVISRMVDPDKFIDDLKKFGFTLSKKDTSHKMFIFLDFTKTGKFNRTKLPVIELKP